MVRKGVATAAASVLRSPDAVPAGRVDVAVVARRGAVEAAGGVVVASATTAVAHVVRVPAGMAGLSGSRSLKCSLLGSARGDVERLGAMRKGAGLAETLVVRSLAVQEADVLALACGVVRWEGDATTRRVDGRVTRVGVRDGRVRGRVLLLLRRGARA